MLGLMIITGIVGGILIHKSASARQLSNDPARTRGTARGAVLTDRRR